MLVVLSGKDTLQDRHLLLLVNDHVMVPIHSGLMLVGDLTHSRHQGASGVGINMWKLHLTDGLDRLNRLLVDKMVELVWKRNRLLWHSGGLVMEQRLSRRLNPLVVMVSILELLRGQTWQLLRTVTIVRDAVGLDREVDDSATDLHCFVVAW